MTYFVQIVSVDPLDPGSSDEPSTQLLPGTYPSAEEAHRSGLDHVNSLERSQGCIAFRVLDGSGHCVEYEVRDSERP